MTDSHVRLPFVSEEFCESFRIFFKNVLTEYDAL
jgi:hypothetical protein